jgi:hypothetical protein
MFAFPHGMHLTLADAGQFPLPLFFTFVFTDADGKHFYVACLQFYEQVHEADLQEAFCSVHGADKVSCVDILCGRRGCCIASTVLVFLKYMPHALLYRCAVFITPCSCCVPINCPQ